MLVRNYFVGLVCIISSLALVTAQSESETWVDKLEFSLYASANGKQGASESDNMILGLEAQYDNEAGSVWDLMVQGDLQRTKNRTVERSYELSLDYAKSYTSSPWGWYTGVDYEADAFQEIEKETSANFGVLLDLFEYLGKDKQIDEQRSHDWQLGLGAVYTNSEDSAGVTTEGQGFTIGYDYAYESEGSYTFEQHLGYEFYPDEDELDTIALENSVTFPFAANRNLKLKLGLDYEYYPNTSGGAEDYEFSYYSNIVWNF